MTHIIDSDGLMLALDAFSTREEQGFSSDVIVTISDLGGRPITDFELSGCDLPAFSEFCKQAITNRLAQKRAALQDELAQINNHLGILDARSEGCTPYLRGAINYTKAAVLSVMPQMEMVTDKEALIVKGVLDSIPTPAGSKRTREWTEENIKRRFTCDEAKKSLVLLPVVTEKEGVLTRIKRLVNEAYPDAQVSSEKELENILEKITEQTVAGSAFSDIDGRKIIKDCYRVEATTQILVTEGFVVFDGEVVFASEDDALLYLKKHGYNFDDFGDAHNAGEQGDIKACWYEDLFGQ